MARFRNNSADELLVGYGLPGSRVVAPDEVFDVADEAAESYLLNPELWGPVGDVAIALSPAPPAPPAPDSPEEA